jgi:biopolymer transport protein TolR
VSPIRASRSRRRAPVAEINVTPMVDVMLVLLIIFMVTAPLMTAGVPVNLPDAAAKPLTQERQPVAISLDRAGKLFVADREVDSQGFADELTRLTARGDPPQVMLRADRGLDYGRVMAVMAQLNRAGINKIALVTTGDTR